MNKPRMRIPYTAPFSPPTIIPPSAATLPGAVAALLDFITAPSPSSSSSSSSSSSASTLVLSGAGLSVASGLADYRGTRGTYRVNPTYRPIYYHDFLASHEARKRYWARSFLGWSTLHRGRPNAGHYAVRDLGDLGHVSGVITQNVDSFHARAHPRVPTLELHGSLRTTVCTGCGHEGPRDGFQRELARLNPRWASFLADVLAAGPLDPEDPDERRARGLTVKPDGDVDLPGAPYSTFRYPACPACLASPPRLPDGTSAVVEVDHEGAWKAGGGGGTAGIVKPAVVMFGEGIRAHVKLAAEEAIDSSARLLILATSLATYSAWRLVRRAKDRGMPIALVNVGGVRGEHVFFQDLNAEQTGAQGVRTEMATESLLPALVEALRLSPPCYRR